jgi:uncharacterized protein (TIGR03663 family)
MKKSKTPDSRLFVCAFLLIIALAFGLRFFMLDDKPLQFDEDRHWFYQVSKIYNWEKIHYYPNFHGFASWYLGALPFFFFGESVFALRFMIALFGALSVCLLWFLRNYLGRTGVIVSALFFAVSPSMVYYSRMFSQYLFFVFFLLLFIVLIAKYFENSRAVFLYLAAVSAGLLYATHEMHFLLLAAVALSFVLFSLKGFFGKSFRLFAENFLNALKKAGAKRLSLCILLFFFIVSLVMSSFFTGFESLRSFLLFSGSDVNVYKIMLSSPQKHFFYYVFTMLPIELPAFAGLILGFLLLRKKPFFAFLLYCAVIALVFYSILPYKVPWVFTIVLVFLFLMLGLVAEHVFSIAKTRALKALLFAAFIALFAFSLNASVFLNFSLPSGKQNALDDFGTSPQIFQMLSEVKNYLAENPSKIKLGFSPEGLLSFYLKDYEISVSRNFKSRELTDENYAVFIILESQLDTNSSEPLNFESRHYNLRWDKDIVVLFRKNRP